MLNKLLSQIRRFEMISPGDTVICAVSGGADSMALLWGMYLLKEKLDITLEAAHFNHGLRGPESDRDEAFVRAVCSGYGITCHVGSGEVKPGKKGLEAAARAARYAFFSTLSGKIATAHTADDNAETVLMHLVRGTGLKGLGGITPVNGNLIRPMLTLSREDVLEFLDSYHLSFVQDSSNETDAFLRNRLRHHVMPLLKQENPRLSQNLSVMAMELRNDEAALQAMAAMTGRDVAALQQAEPAVRNRAIAAFLKESGVVEPEREHIALAQNLVFSDKPSATADFSGGVRISRNYNELAVAKKAQTLSERELVCPGVTEVPEAGIRVCCGDGGVWVKLQGKLVLRSRRSGDTIRLSGGTKTLKKLFIDRKIPAAERDLIPVLADDLGVLAVYGIGFHTDRLTQKETGISIRFEEIE